MDWRHNWKLAQAANSHLVCDPTIRQPNFDIPRQQWSLLNHSRTEQKHCSACRRKWRLADTDLCPCCETQMMSHIVESCPLTKLDGGLSWLHSADEDAVACFLADQLCFMTRIREDRRNSLSDDVIQSSSVNMFKRRLQKVRERKMGFFIN